MTEKMSKTDAVLYVVDTGKATITECLKRHDARTSAIRREWLITVGATLDTARAEIERLQARIAEVERERDGQAESLEAVEVMLAYFKSGDASKDLSEAMARAHRRPGDKGRTFGEMFANRLRAEDEESDGENNP